LKALKRATPQGISEAVIQAKVNQAAKIVEETQRGKAPTRS
jgi:hypothetical protein